VKSGAAWVVSRVSAVLGVEGRGRAICINNPRHCGLEPKSHTIYALFRGLRLVGRNDGGWGVNSKIVACAREERLDIAKNLLEINRPVDEIAKATRLTREEVERLRDAN